MVEFGLVIPILLVLVVAVADFGRIFATGVILEAAARNAAELGANEYLANAPGSRATPPIPLNAPAPTGNSAYYGPLHETVAKAVCAETQELPNSTYDPVTGACTGMPFVMVCVHDSQDNECKEDGAAVSAGCNEFTPRAINTHGGSLTPRWVEVRVCYQFTSILQLPLISFGDFMIQKTRSFTIPCYFALGAEECG